MRKSLKFFRNVIEGIRSYVKAKKYKFNLGSYSHKSFFLPSLPVIFSHFWVSLKFFSNFFFSRSEMTFHNFRICFSRSLPCLFSEFHSHIKYSWSHMLSSCELYLQFCFFCFCIFFKYFEYEVYSIPSNSSNIFKLRVEIIHLMRF